MRNLKPFHAWGIPMERLLWPLVILAVSLCTAAAPIPEGWRLPGKTELHRDQGGGGNHNFFRIKADFNGDGIEDEAMVLVKEKDRGAALFAFVSQENGYKTCMLDVLEETWWLGDVGIDVAVPGEYISACGTLYFDCGPGENEQFILNLPGIRYYKAGCSDSIFWWDCERKRFKRIWTVEGQP